MVSWRIDIKSKIVVLEVIVFIVLLAIGTAWMLDPSGDYEPFFVVVSLSFVGTEIYRRIVTGREKLKPKLNEITPIQDVSDEEFMLLDKIAKLTLSSNAYHPETDEVNICISLSNKGYFYKDSDFFVLTTKCKEYLGK